MERIPRNNQAIQEQDNPNAKRWSRTRQRGAVRAKIREAVKGYEICLGLKPGVMMHGMRGLNAIGALGRQDRSG